MASAARSWSGVGADDLAQSTVLASTHAPCAAHPVAILTAFQDTTSDSCRRNDQHPKIPCRSQTMRQDHRTDCAARFRKRCNSLHQVDRQECPKQCQQSDVRFYALSSLHLLRSVWVFLHKIVLAAQAVERVDDVAAIKLFGIRRFLTPDTR